MRGQDLWTIRDGKILRLETSFLEQDADSDDPRPNPPPVVLARQERPCPPSIHLESVGDASIRPVCSPQASPRLLFTQLVDAPLSHVRQDGPRYNVQPYG